MDQKPCEGGAVHSGEPPAGGLPLHGPGPSLDQSSVMLMTFPYKYLVHPGRSVLDPAGVVALSALVVLNALVPNPSGLESFLEVLSVFSTLSSSVPNPCGGWVLEAV